MQNVVSKSQIKDIVVRSVKTFVQGALAYAVVEYANVKDVQTRNAFIFGAVAAGIAAVMNISIQIKRNI